MPSLIDDDDNDNDANDDDLSLDTFESGEANYMCCFKTFQYPCATTWKYKADREQYNQLYVVWFLKWSSLWFEMKMYVIQIFS